MNLHEGRIGRQESIALAAAALSISGLFASDFRGMPDSGNSAYIYLPIALGLSLAAFLLIGAAMKRCGARDLATLNSAALGVAAPLFGALLSLALCLASAAVLNHFVILLHRYVFVGAGYPELVFYCVLPSFFMAWKGLECISRTAKFFAWILLLSILLELVIASSGYEMYRLFPIAGEGVEPLLQSAGRNMGLFLPAFAMLMICSHSLQGRKNTKSYGIWAACIAGVLIATVSFAVALSFPYNDVGEVFSPLYRMSSLGKVSKYPLRLDKILLFLWLTGGMIVSASYNYAAALQYAKSFHQQDTRPAAVSFSLISAAVVLLHQAASLHFDIMAAVTRYSTLVILGLLLIPTTIALIKRPQNQEARA